MTEATPAIAAIAPAVDAIRAFNRFYTRYIGLLDEQHLGSGMSLAEVRLLYELAHAGDASPSALAKELNLDPGYTTRLVQSLERRGLIRRANASDDGRRSMVGLNAAGRKTIAGLERATRERLGTRLEPLSDDERLALVGAMRSVERLLDRDRPPTTVELRAPRPGDIGHVIARQAALYAREYGWDWTYEALIAGICSRFIDRFDESSERCWIADRDGEAIGSVFLVRKSATVAQLRLLYVEPSARGLGVGTKLVDACIRFARAAGYRRIALWTNDVLVSARRIYEAAGFVLVNEAPHRSFGADLVGQTWTLPLR